MTLFVCLLVCLYVCVSLCPVHIQCNNNFLYLVPFLSHRERQRRRPLAGVSGTSSSSFNSSSPVSLLLHPGRKISPGPLHVPPPTAQPPHRRPLSLPTTQPLLPPESRPTSPKSHILPVATS